LGELTRAFETVIDNYTAGDPMQDGVRWTNLTRSEIAAGMSAEGCLVSVTIVDRLLDHFGFRRRKPRKVQTMGTAADRDAQFRKIGKLKKDYLRRGQPVLSIDTKKREILGQYVRPGRLLSTAPLAGWDHDFPTHSPGVAIPHGVFDLARNEGHVHLGTSHDTSEFAVDSLWWWWLDRGRHLYAEASDLLLLCDSGGSHGCRRLLFKEELASLAKLTGLRIRVAHYPTYCSKYNPIDHRLFPHLTRVCQGMFLTTIELFRRLMEKATTKSGLRVFASVIDKAYELGRTASRRFVERMPVRFDRLLPTWNYVVLPSRLREVI
jgi:hypothetical protein